MKNVLNVMNFIFAVTFTVEMLLKIFGMGFVGYFTNLWNCLDFFIVAVCFFFLEIRNAEMSSLLYSTWRYSGFLFHSLSAHACFSRAKSCSDLPCSVLILR